MGKIYPDDESKSFNKGHNYKGGKKQATVVLDTYGTNITKLALDNKLDPVIGRDEEILRIVQILGRRRKNNPVLVGHAGVGKTSVIEGLALKIISGDVPAILQGKIIYTLELSTIVAGTKYRGQFEERLKAIVDELIANPNVIIFIDELHTLVGAGNSSGSLDASNIMKPALARGEIRCIGATTFDEFRESIENDAALARRFQQVVINEPSLDETEHILLNIRDKYESHHNVIYTEEIISLIVKLADRYITDRYFPDKAIDIMDEVGSYRHITDMKIPPGIKRLEEKLVNRESLKVQAVLKQDYELAARERDLCIGLKNKIELEKLAWKKSIEENKTSVTEDDVLYVISKLSGVPLEKINDKENKNLLGINKYLESHIIGQKEAIDKISITIQRNRIGIRNRNRTAGNFIFLGSSGTGKTFLSKKIAEYLFNSSDNLIRIDMSEYMEPHSISKLIGSPPGYIGHESGGFLTEQVKNKPYSVVLFDEIEKAHPDVFNVLLQMLDDGHMTDSLGRTIDFRNCLIILTSNAGSRDLDDFGKGIGFNTNATSTKQEEHEHSVLMKALNRKFPPEFLNRIDEIIIFNKLTLDDIVKILNNECKEIAKNLKEINGYNIKISKTAKDLIAKQGYDPKYGARPLRRTIERLIENPIAEMILDGSILPGDDIFVKEHDGKIKIETGKTNKL